MSDTNTKVSVWSKTDEDLTVGDQVKVAGAVVAVCTATTLAIYGAVYGGAVLADKAKTRWKSWRKSHKSK